MALRASASTKQPVPGPNPCDDRPTKLAKGSSPQAEGSVPQPNAIERYYMTLESRLGYWLFLGNTRHCSWYPTATTWPFPRGPALRAMEDKLMTALKLPQGSKVLDAGCGDGHVALYMAKTGGFHVTGIDITPRHQRHAQRNATTAGMDDRVTIQLGSYEQIEHIPDGSLDGIYTIETFVHAKDPQRALREFLRVLRPGGRIVMNEYAHMAYDKSPAGWVALQRLAVEEGAMPSYEMFEYGVLEEMLRTAGFTDIAAEDWSLNIEPMLWFGHYAAYLPYQLIRLSGLGMQKRFINTASAYWGYKAKDCWRYMHYAATKPGPRPTMPDNDILEH